MFSFVSFLAVRLLCMRYTMQIVATTKKIIATKDGTHKNKIPKPIEMIINRIAIEESAARFWSFLICILSSSFN